MLRRITVMAAVALGVLTLAIPAGATTNVRHASFGSHGSASFGYRHGHWIGNVHVRGLPAGNYQFEVYFFVDENHDGIPDGGVTRDVCNFTITARRHEAHCRGAVTTMLDDVRGPGAWGDINGAEIVRLADHTGIVVLDRPLR